MLLEGKTAIVTGASGGIGKAVAIATGKYIGDCRLTHYSALLRKALDDAGYPGVAILTNDDVDYHDLHPGFRMNLMSAIRLAGALPMMKRHFL